MQAKTKPSLHGHRHGSLTLNDHTKHFLVVEDDPDISGLIALHLKDFGAKITVANDGQTGLDQALTQSWDMIMLDLQLPRVDGLDICRAIRAQSDYVPIMMVTSRSTELDRVLGLEIGADDYLVKPFSIAELKARIKALLRRVNPPTPRGTASPSHSDTLSYLDLRIDSSSRKVKLRESPIDLTAREFDLLWFFASHPGVVFRRSELLDKVWGYGHEGYEHTVNSHINRLRSKLEINASSPSYIHTIWGVGYRFGT